MRTGDRLLAARYAGVFREHRPYVLLTIARRRGGGRVRAARGGTVRSDVSGARARLARPLVREREGPARRRRQTCRERGRIGSRRSTPRRSRIRATRLDHARNRRARGRLAHRHRRVAGDCGRNRRRLRRRARSRYNRRSRNQSREGAFAGGAGSAKIVSAAIPPLSSVWPRTLATVLMAGIAGLLLGVGFAVAIERASPIVTDAESLAEHSRLRLLARLPLPTHKEVRQLLLGSYDARAELDEKTRSLSAIVSGLLPSWSEPKTVLVLGAGDGHGSPAVAAALAGRLARSGMAVTLVDLDFERQRLAKIVQGAVSPAPSVGQILMARDSRTLLDAIQPVSHSHRLRMLVARDDRHLAGESVPLLRVPALSRDLKARANALVISAPSLPAAEMRALLDEADALIAVVAVGHTRREQVASLRQALPYARFGYVAVEPQRGLARLLGAVSAFSCRSIEAYSGRCLTRPRSLGFSSSFPTQAKFGTSGNPNPVTAFEAKRETSGRSRRYGGAESIPTRWHVSHRLRASSLSTYWSPPASRLPRLDPPVQIRQQIGQWMYEFAQKRLRTNEAGADRSASDRRPRTGLPTYDAGADRSAYDRQSRLGGSSGCPDCLGRQRRRSRRAGSRGTRVRRRTRSPPLPPAQGENEQSAGKSIDSSAPQQARKWPDDFRAFGIAIKPSGKSGESESSTTA